jgi:hypothetical protein
MDRAIRTKAIAEGAWFSAFGITTPLGTRFYAERQNVRRLYQGTEDEANFGGNFSDMFRPERQPLTFAQRYWPDADTVGILNAVVSKFERAAAAHGFIIPAKEIRVRIDASATELSCAANEVVLPQNPKNVQASVLWGVAFDMFDIIGSDTDLSEQLATYLVADFLDSPRLDLDGASLDIGADPANSRDGSASMRLAQGLWQLRRVVGAPTTGKLVSSALRRFTGTSNSTDPVRLFASLVKIVATPATAPTVQTVWHKYGLDDQ